MKKKKIPDLFVEFNPSLIAFDVGVLQPKKPNLPETNGFNYLIEELLACRGLLNREL